MAPEGQQVCTRGANRDAGLLSSWPAMAGGGNTVKKHPPKKRGGESRGVDHVDRCPSQPPGTEGKGPEADVVCAVRPEECDLQPAPRDGRQRVKIRQTNRSMVVG